MFRAGICVLVSAEDLGNVESLLSGVRVCDWIWKAFVGECLSHTVDGALMLGQCKKPRCAEDWDRLTMEEIRCDVAGRGDHSSGGPMKRVTGREILSPTQGDQRVKC